ncbi:MAG: hydroxyisourate hydrolase [Kofleriaceae bacterium]
MITTHVLDTALGRPAAGIPIELERVAQESVFGGTTEWTMVGSGTSDADGRLRTLTGNAVEAGTYRLRFQTAVYFDTLRVKGFFPVVEIQFVVEDGAQHHHVPLLLSPYGYSTYRGS